MSATIAHRAAAMLATVHANRGQPARVGKLVAFDGLMLETTGLDLPVGSTARIGDSPDGASLAEVIGFRGDRSLLMAFDPDRPFIRGEAVRADGHGGMVAVGPGLLGRVTDGLGTPLDDGGAIAASGRWPLTGIPGNPLRRASVREPLDVGVRAINALLTVGVGQRVAIVAGSGVGKSVLLGQILAGVDAEIIVIGLVGERSREVSDFLSERLPPAVRAKSVVVAVPADHAPVLRLRAAMRATAIAEYFRSTGKRVLLLIDSLTRVAHAQREIGLSLGEPPTVKGYPPSTFGLIPRLLERAGIDRSSGGSITAFYTVLADGDDNDDPIVDSARAIADGHIILSRPLAEANVYPAIDVGRSLSRVMSDVVAPDHGSAAARLRQLWSAYEANADLIRMGVYAAGSDATIDRAIASRSEMLDFLCQPAAMVVPIEDAVAALHELVQ